MRRTAHARISAALEAAREYLQIDAVFVGEFRNGHEHFPWVSGDAASFGVVAGDTAVPLEQTYCARVAAGRLPNLIRDTDENATSRLIPGTRAARIGAYVGVPLRRGDGGQYGMLCAVHHTPRPDFDDRDVRFLRTVADMLTRELADAATLVPSQTKAALQGIIDRELFDTAYQPIVDLATGRFAGFEALTRFRAEPAQPPDLWFAQAADFGLRQELELATLGAALRGWAAVPAGPFLSVNCSPAVASTEALRNLLIGFPGQIVVEITEHEQVSDYDALYASLTRMRQAGIRIAVDDAGAGFSSLAHILKLAPDFIKLDLTLTRGIDHDPVRRSLGTALSTFAGDIGAVLVAEGVETHAEEQALAELGVSLAQGFYFGRPAASWGAPGAYTGRAPDAGKCQEQSPVEPTHRPGAPDAGRAAGVVLVVEDDPALRRALQAGLRQHGFTTERASDALEATAAAYRLTIDAVLLDLQLSGGTAGLSFLEWFRRQPQYSRTPVLILTGKRALTEEEDALIRRHGAYLFHKPQQISVLAEYLTRLIGRREDTEGL